MFKTFIVGVVLGLALAAGAAYLLPVADLHREASLITVLPNGGNSELFQIRVPEDRIVGGGSDVSALTPASLKWPQTATDNGLQLELFKLRNRDDVVVGVASRIAAAAANGRPAALEWALHLPARGTIYFPMAASADAAGSRTGQMRAGTREFLRRTGSLREQFIAEPGSGDGRIELRSSLLGESEIQAEGGSL